MPPSSPATPTMAFGRHSLPQLPFDRIGKLCTHRLRTAPMPEPLTSARILFHSSNSGRVWQALVPHSGPRRSGSSWDQQLIGCADASRPRTPTRPWNGRLGSRSLLPSRPTPPAPSPPGGRLGKRSFSSRGVGRRRQPKRRLLKIVSFAPSPRGVSPPPGEGADRTHSGGTIMMLMKRGRFLFGPPLLELAIGMTRPPHLGPLPWFSSNRKLGGGLGPLASGF